MLSSSKTIGMTSHTSETLTSKPTQMTAEVAFLVSKVSRSAVSRVCSRLYRDREGHKPTVLIAGSARSGTTWLAESLASVGRCRLIYEPFNPHMIPEYSSFNYFTYERVGRENAGLEDYCRRLFAGTIRNRWIDQKVTTLRPDRRLVKAVRGNLLLPWLRVHFTHVPVILLVRNPFAVVASRMKLGWATDDDIRPMLSQPALIEDYLHDMQGFLGSLSRPEEKHAAIWCIHNLVPLRGLAESGTILTYYENLCGDPVREIERIASRIEWPANRDMIRRMGKPSSTTTSASTVLSGEPPVSSWRGYLSESQSERVRAVVRDFGLDYLYGDQDTPLRQEDPWNAAAR